PDGLTNTINYDATFTTQIGEVIDPYGRRTTLSYDSTGHLTNITDTTALKSAFLYDSSGNITNLHTPYGDTGFSVGQVTSGERIQRRSAEITRTDGSKELYVYRDTFGDLPNFYPETVYPSNAPMFKAGAPVNTINDAMTNRNSFYWGALQYPQISLAARTNLDNLTTNDLKYAR